MPDAPPAAPGAAPDPFSILAATPEAAAASLAASRIAAVPPSPVDPLSLSPLAAVTPETLTAYFEADPTTLSDDEFRLLLTDLRRRRSAYQAEEAAKQAKGKKDKPAPALEADGSRSPVAIANAALRDGPAEEITLDKLIG